MKFFLLARHAHSSIINSINSGKENMSMSWFAQTGGPAQHDTIIMGIVFTSTGMGQAEPLFWKQGIARDDTFT